MSVLAAAKGQILDVVRNFAEHAPGGAARQTVTVSCSVVQAEDFWRDATRLSTVLGDVGEVRFTEPDRYTWELHSGPATMTWNSRLVGENGGLRFVGDGGEIAVGYRPAPNHLGTELTVRTSSALPGLLSGALAFKFLYRVRALLQTGEVPTITKNPSARSSAR